MSDREDCVRYDVIDYRNREDCVRYDLGDYGNREDCVHYENCDRCLYRKCRCIWVDGMRDRQRVNVCKGWQHGAFHECVARLHCELIVMY